MKKLYWCYGITLLVLVLSPAVSAFTGSVYSGTYTDADPNNTAAVNGTSPWYSATDSTTLWKVRTPLGNNGIVYEAGNGTANTGDHVQLATTVSDLTPGAFYKVYVIFWTADGQDWRVWAGLTETVKKEFSKANSKDTTAQETDRSEYEGYIGVAVADALGKVKVYIDDQLNYSRSWYDGVVVARTQAVIPTLPADGARHVEVPTNFSWQMSPDPGVLSHELIVCPSEPNAASPSALKYTVTDLVNPIEYTVTTLQANQNYYWRVDEKISDTNSIAGDWSMFYSIVTIPSFDPPYGTQPVGASVMLNDEVIFTAVSGVSPGHDSPVDYQWYKGASGVTTSPVSNETGHITGAQTTQLTIQVQAGDEGLYWCRAINGEGTGNSNAAMLSIKKLLAHYKFDDNLDDSVGTNHATMTEPSYDTGINGKGLIFDGTKYAAIPTSGFPKAGDGNGLVTGSVSFWIKTTAIAGGASFFGTANASPDTTRLQLVYANGNRLQAYVRNSASQEMFYEVLPNGSIYNNVWHMMTFTWDTAVGAGKIYIDGVLATSQTLTAIAGFNPWLYPIAIGAYNNAGTASGFYNGVMDDVRVYNYVITPKEVATLYTDFVSGVVICAEKPAYDYNNDCKVNLTDFLEVMTEWLDCNLVPNGNCL